MNIFVESEWNIRKESKIVLERCTIKKEDLGETVKDDNESKKMY